MATAPDPTEITILVVDDEEDNVEILSHFMLSEGYRVERAFDGDQALEVLRRVNNDVHLILLDIMMPGKDGFEVVKILRGRAETEHIPVIFLSAKSEDEDQVRGLMMGADAFLSKPVSPSVVVANVKSVLRRAGVGESRVMQVNDLTIYEDEYRASLSGVDLGLTLTEFELLRYLVRHPRKAFTRQQLLETIWKDAMMVTERTVDAHIKNLREKLGAFAVNIQTVRGVGYRFVEDGSASEAN